MSAKTAGRTFEANLARLTPLLANLKAEGIGHVIGGKRVDGKATFLTHSPVDKSSIASVAQGTAEDIDRAAVAAKKAFKAWSKWAPDRPRLRPIPPAASFMHPDLRSAGST